MKLLDKIIIKIIHWTHIALFWIFKDASQRTAKTKTKITNTKRRSKGSLVVVGRFEEVSFRFSIDETFLKRIKNIKIRGRGNRYGVISGYFV